MAGRHLGLQQNIRSHLAQPGHPLGRLDVEHSGVVETGHGEYPRVVRVAHVLHGGVAAHIGVHLRVVQRVAPLVPLDHGQRQRRVQDRRQRVHERHPGEDAREQFRGQVRHGAHQQAAGAAALGDEPVGTGVALVDQVPGAVDEVREAVALVQLLAVLVPESTQLAAAAHVGDREDHAAVEQAEPGDAERRVDADLVGAVAVEQGRGGSSRSDEVTPVDEGDRDARAVGGGSPLAALLEQGRVVAAEHGLLLPQPALAGGDHVVVDRRRRDEAGVTETDGRRVPLGIGRRAHGVQRFLEAELDEIEFLVGCLGAHGNAGESVPPVFGHHEVAECVDALEAHGRIVGQ